MKHKFKIPIIIKARSLIDNLHDKNFNYFLVKFSTLIGLLTILLSAYMAFENYQSTVKLRLDGYHRMLRTLDSSYLVKLISENERELEVLTNSLDINAIRQGESAINSLWPVAHRIKMEENHFIYFYNASKNKIDSYPDWTPSYGFDVTQRPWFYLLDSKIEKTHWIGPYPEFGSGELVLTLGKKINDINGTSLGLLLVDMPVNHITKTLSDSLGNLDVSLFLKNIKTGEVLSIVNSALYKNEGADSTNKDVALGGLSKGALVLHSLEYIDWQLGMYVPPTRFISALKVELSKALFPVCIVLLIVWLGAISLIKVFRQEQKIILERLRKIDEDSYKHDTRKMSWFIGKSLSEIDKIRDQHQKNRLELRLDPLTGVLNRRAFEQDVESLRNKYEPRALILIDLDKFKLINDSFGHQTGDLVLCRVADSLILILGFEQVYRIGGDEFAALISVEADGFSKKIDSLIHHVRRLKWREHNCSVTLSIGVSCGPGEPTEIFKKADSALYRSKSNGRDCWSIEK